MRERRGGERGRGASSAIIASDGDVASSHPEEVLTQYGSAFCRSGSEMQRRSRSSSAAQLLGWFSVENHQRTISF